jgi:hypothetical protein
MLIYWHYTECGKGDLTHILSFNRVYDMASSFCLNDHKITS